MGQVVPHKNQPSRPFFLFLNQRRQLRIQLGLPLLKFTESGSDRTARHTRNVCYTERERHKRLFQKVKCKREVTNLSNRIIRSQQIYVTGQIQSQPRFQHIPVHHFKSTGYTPSTGIRYDNTQYLYIISPRKKKRNLAATPKAVSALHALARLHDRAFHPASSSVIKTLIIFSRSHSHTHSFSVSYVIQLSIAFLSIPPPVRFCVYPTRFIIDRLRSQPVDRTFKKSVTLRYVTLRYVLGVFEGFVDVLQKGGGVRVMAKFKRQTHIWII